MKVVLFGDSLLKNFGREAIESLKNAVSEIEEVYNCATGGLDTNDGVRQAPAIGSLRMDIAIIGFGTNDSAHWKQVPIDRYKENIKQILGNFAGSKIIYFLPPPVRSHNGHDSEHHRAAADVKLYHDTAKDLLASMGVTYLDSRAVFMPLLESNKEYHIEDGVHLNDFGYEVLIKEFARLIKEIS